MTDITPHWLDTPTLCAYTCTSDKTIEAWIRTEGFPPARPRGGKRFWKRSEVDAWMEGGSDKVDELNLAERVRHATRAAVNAR